MEVEVDSQAVSLSLNWTKQRCASGWAFIKAIRRRRLMSADCQVFFFFSHVYREANRLADAIANRGIGMEEDFFMYNQQSTFLDQLLFEDV